MKNRWNVSYLLAGICIVVFLGVLSSCEKEEQVLYDQELQPDDSLQKCGWHDILTNYELVNSMSSETIKQIVGPSFASLIKYGVNMYKVSYRTKYNGRAIIASGVVGIPDTIINRNTKIVMYDHGTRITEADLIPSGGFDLISVVSSANGKICFAADYIGYGDSKQIYPPYLVKSATIYPVCDMILAGKEFLGEVFHIFSKPSITIFGFSQGGSVTMAVQRELEKNPYYRSKVKLNGVAMATGPYDLHDSAILPIVSGNSYPSPSFLLFAFTSFNEYYHLRINYDDIFKNSYAQLFFDLVEQNKTTAQIDASLPSSMADLFQENFRGRFITGQTPFNYLFNLNTTYKGWIPKSPTRIYHSPADEIVPYANAQIAYNTFIAAGATSVELMTLPPVSHANSAFMAYADILSWIDSQ